MANYLACAFCENCGTRISEYAKFCQKCAAPVEGESPNVSAPPKRFIVVTAPAALDTASKEFSEWLQVLTPRTRRTGGKIAAGIQSMLYGDVTAFGYEIEKVRTVAINRAIDRTQEIGANAIVGLDIETSDILQSLVLISAASTGVIAEPEKTRTPF